MELSRMYFITLLCLLGIVLPAMAQPGPGPGPGGGPGEPPRATPGLDPVTLSGMATAGYLGYRAMVMRRSRPDRDKKQD